MRIATQAAERAIQAAYDSLRAGSTELKIGHMLQVILAKERSGCRWTHVAFGPKGAANIMLRDTAALLARIIHEDVRIRRNSFDG